MSVFQSITRMNRLNLCAIFCKQQNLLRTEAKIWPKKCSCFESCYRYFRLRKRKALFQQSYIFTASLFHRRTNFSWENSNFVNFHALPSGQNGTRYFLVGSRRVNHTHYKNQKF